MNVFSKKWIESIQKIINLNGCWIPFYRPKESGYVSVHIGNEEYLLHRVVLCLYYDIDYYNDNIVSRHNTGCSRACFNPEHIKPGTQSDNIQDSLRDGTNKELRKTCCSKCGGPYTSVTSKRGAGVGKTQRYCKYCKAIRRRKKK